MSHPAGPAESSAPGSTHRLMQGSPEQRQPVGEDLDRASWKGNRFSLDARAIPMPGRRSAIVGKNAIGRTEIAGSITILFFPRL